MPGKDVTALQHTDLIILSRFFNRLYSKCPAPFPRLQRSLLPSTRILVPVGASKVAAKLAPF
jgi:hypothetical protein